MKIIYEHESAARRDIRNDRSTPEVSRNGGSRKGRGKVCKKSPTREHFYVPSNRFGLIYATWDACEHCGKYAAKPSR